MDEREHKISHGMEISFQEHLSSKPEFKYYTSYKKVLQPIAENVSSDLYRTVTCWYKPTFPVFVPARDSPGTKIETIKKL